MTMPKDRKDPKDIFEETTNSIIMWIAIVHYGGIVLFFLIAAALFYFGVLGT